MASEPVRMKRVVIVNGCGGVGKDEFCRACGRFAEVAVRSSVDPIKAIARRVGWDGGKTERDRRFLADLKALVSGYSDYLMDRMRGSVNLFNGFGNPAEILFLHVREPEEVERAASEFNAVKVLVTNPRVPPITSNRADARVAECRYDFTVCNDGTLTDLASTAADFVYRLRTGRL